MREIGDGMEIAKSIYTDFYDINRGGTVWRNDKEVLMFGSVNYLGLSHHPRIVEAAIEETRRQGIGGIGSRYSNGCLKIHKELEEHFCDFLAKEDCAIFNSGYMANLGAIAAIGRNALLFSDKENHLSIYDACKLSNAEVSRYRHNDMEHLESLIKKHANHDNKWIVIVGTFGVTGENAKLSDIVRLAEKYKIKIYLDDAHAVGIYGEQKRGLSELSGVTDKIDLLMTSFQMAFGNIGALVAGNSSFVNLLKMYARPYIFSYTLPPSNVRSLLETLRIIRSSEGDDLVRTLQVNVQHLRNGLERLGFQIISQDSQITSIDIGDERKTVLFSKNLKEKGLWLQTYLNPAVPANHGTVRLNCLATHTKEHIDQAIDIIQKTTNEMDLF